MLNTYVSCFSPHSKGKSNDKVHLKEWLLIPNVYTPLVEYIRKIKDTDEIAKFKKKLPGITPSGIFYERKAELIKEYSGIICIDIDGKDNLEISDMEDLKKSLMNSSLGRYIMYCGLSVGGKGIYCLIPLVSPQKHKSHFYALQQDFKALGVIIDSGCSDVCRLRYYSWDESPYLNLEAMKYERLMDKEIIPIPKESRRADFMPVPKESIKIQDNRSLRERMLDQELHENIKVVVESYKDRVLHLIEVIVNSRIDITAKWIDWFAIGCILARKFGEGGREFFHQIGQFFPRYTRQESDCKFCECLIRQGEYHYRNERIFEIAMKYGIEV